MDAQLVQSSNGDTNPTSAPPDQQSHAATGINSQTHGNSNRPNRPSARTKTNLKSNHHCRFFLSKSGCRAGEQCRFQHVRPTNVSESGQTGNTAEAASRPVINTADATSSPPDNASKSVPVSRPAAKPVSQKELENPREYQLTQVVRRYSPFRADLDDKTVLKFRVHPTDPDFPFELETGLHCVLDVPLGYPQDGKPTLQVQNPEMPKGFQINVEKGFDSLVVQYPGKTLLALLNDLDKNLEKFLASAKATTVKFVTPARKDPVIQESEAPVTPDPGRLPPQPMSVIPRYSFDQLREAKIRRVAEIRQLEARLGRSANFSKAGDGVAFNIPLQIPFSDKVPATLRSLRESALIVPEVYPLEPCTIILRGVDGDDAENVEVAFEKHVVSNSTLTLMAHINYLTQNLGKMSVHQKPRIEVGPGDNNDANEGADGVVVASAVESLDDGVVDPSRPHLKFIARPPEWAVNAKHDSSDETDSSSAYESDEDEDPDSEVESTAGGASLPQGSVNTERGISISFPGLDLNGIELLELISLSIMVRCERCKEPVDIKNIKPSKSDDSTNLRRTESCTKCTAPFTFIYRSELMHMNSNRAGFIEVENCTISDLLPSNFQPTCASCSTPHPATASITAVPDGDHPTLTVCRTCHAKMTLRIPDVKFLRITSSASTTTGLPLRKPKNPLGLTANTPLPNNGKCTHYSKSYRWFRFSCCNTVYPCDKCHDTSPTQKENPHPNEHADRMICGWCSREQRYHPDTCRFCGHSVVKKVITSGFWEGGKGTRDKNLMRRKEGRKFKRSGREKKEVEAARAKRKEGKGKGGMWWPG